MSAGRPIPIAVIGMGCRLPGGVNSPSQLWDLVSSGGSGWGPVPADRWSADSFYHPDLDAKESMNSKTGYFLQQDLRDFDAGFFNVSVHEGHTMDPQQRVLLETSFQALEDAGLPLDKMRGSDTAVFIGLFGRDYYRMGFKDVAQMSKMHTTGTGDAVLSNRISYALDLKGASMSIDTGCSASMSALHQAVLTVRSGESRMAIAGGVELLLDPDQSITLSSGGLSNAEGKCFFLDSRGSGYARGEGAGVVVLKQLGHAIEDGDNIHAVILNSCLNQDGKTAGISLPSAEAQAALMRPVYAAAGVDPADTLYVEAHGTGTQAGDNAEISSIASVFCPNPEARKTDLYVGSVKCNIGHLEAASGIAGLIHSIMVLKKGQIPRNLNFEEEKPTLKLDQRGIHVPLELRPLIPPGYDGPVRVSVNGFGYGGTNGHFLLESIDSVLRHGLPTAGGNVKASPTRALSHANGTNGVNGAHKTNGATNGVNGHSANGDDHHTPLDREPANGHHAESKTAPVSPQTQDNDAGEASPLLFPFSAATETALLATASSLQNWLSSQTLSRADLEDLSFTLGARRSALAWRAGVVASTQSELSAALTPHALAQHKTKTPSFANAVFVFTGQGAQWFAMGRELMSSSKRFRASILETDRILASLGCGWSLLDELTLRSEAESRIGQSELSQPATTAIQIALVDVLAGYGVSPKAVVGHSSGEIGAAYAAGALSHAAGITVAYRRGVFSAMAKKVNPVRGSMLAVGASEPTVLPLLKRTTPGTVKVACVNSPESVTVSGDDKAIDELQGLLKRELPDLFCRKLKVDTAYHSHHMARIADGYLASLGGIQAGQPRDGVKFFSSVTGEAKTTGFGPAYWTQNLVSQVRFSDALEALVQDSAASNRAAATVLVEIGPHSALAGPIRQTLKHIPGASDLKHFYQPTLVRGVDAVRALLSCTGRLFELGLPTDLTSRFTTFLRDLNDTSTEETRKFRVIPGLPTYPWDHTTKYWYESRLSRDHRLRAFPTHDLAGLLDPASSSLEPRWRHHVSVAMMPWLRHHVVDGLIIFPGAGYICMAMEALKQHVTLREPGLEIERFVLRNVTLSKPIVLQEADSLVGAVPEVEMQLVLSPDKTREGSPWVTYRILSYGAGGTWSEHSTGLIKAETKDAQQHETPTTDDPLTKEEDDAFAADALAKFEALQGVASEAVDPDHFYALMRDTGNAFGPSFRGVTDIKLVDAGSKGCATITIQDVRSHMPKGYMQPHVIHPATLDAVNQLSALMFKRRCVNAPIMPTFMSEIVIGTRISSAPGSQIVVGMEILPEGKTAASGNTWAFQRGDDGKLELVGTTTGWRMQSIGEEIRDEAKLPFHRRMNYETGWVEDVDFLTEAHLNDRLHGAQDAASEAMARAVLARLDLHEGAAALYVRNNLATLAQEDSEGLDTIRQAAAATPHLSKWLAWMEFYAASDASRALLASIPAPTEAALLEESQNSGFEGAMLARMGQNALSILKGETDPLQLMLEDDLLPNFYGDKTIFPSYDHLATYTSILARNTPRMRILEIGAGTGGATWSILDALSEGPDGSQGARLKSYTYTDVSAGFFDKAQSRFAEWAGSMDFRTLDITRDPAAQGFEAGGYDLIVASNVLHATPRMEETMAHVRGLLRPGGRLLLVELTFATAVTMTIFGTLEGWWGFDDGRTHDPLLSRRRWDELLRASGFNGIEVSSRDLREPSPRSTMMVSRAVEPTPSIGTGLVPAGPSSRVTILLPGPETSEVGQALARGLASEFSRKGLSTSTASSMEALAETTDLDDDDAEDGVVFVVVDGAETSIVRDPSEADYLHLRRFLTADRRILWVSFQERASPELQAVRAMATGLARVVRREHEGTRFITLDVAAPLSSAANDITPVVEAAVAIADSALLSHTDKSSAARNPEPEYRLAPDGRLLVPRIQTDAKFNAWIDQVNGLARPVRKQKYLDAENPLALEVEKPGLLGSMRFVPDTTAAPLGADEIELESRAHGVNARDVQIALGKARGGLSMVGEVAGVVTAVGADMREKYRVGDRVMGLRARQPFGSRPRLHGLHAAVIPDYVSFAEGASIPLALLTAYYSLVEVAKLEAGQSVLIQAGSGSIGQAAIQITEHLGMLPKDIFVTVSTATQRQLMTSRFGILEDHIFSSTSPSFKTGVLRLTGGRGVDVVLNSLAGEMLAASWDCVAPLGVHVEIGKDDIQRRNHLAMEGFDKGATFAAVDVLALLERQPRRMHSCFGEAVALLAGGVILQPSQSVVKLPVDQVEAAFRLVEERKHDDGKVVLEVTPEAVVEAVAPSPEPLRLDSNASYVVAGGLGDLGRKISRHLAEHGADHIIILSRRKLEAAAKRELEEEISAAGGTLHILRCDITDRSSVEAVAAQCRDGTLPPVRGIIHGGMVLRDGLFANMSWEDYTLSLGPKVDGTINLNDAFSSPHLDFFVMLSSLTSIMGKVSQANYSAGNMFEDEFAHAASASSPNKTRYVSLNLGAIGGSDSILSLPARQLELLQKYDVIMTFDELFRVLEYAMSETGRKDGCVQSVMGFDRASMEGMQDDISLLSPLMALVPYPRSETVVGGEEAKFDIERALRGAQSLEEAEKAILRAVVEKLALFLGRDAADVTVDQPVAVFGLDSLVSIELKNWMVRSFGVALQAAEVTDAPSIVALAGTLAARSKLVGDAVRGPGSGGGGDPNVTSATGVNGR